MLRRPAAVNLRSRSHGADRFGRNQSLQSARAKSALRWCAYSYLFVMDDKQRLMNLCGPLDDHLRQIEQALDVRIARCGHCIRVRGRGAKTALAALENFYQRAAQPLCLEDIQLALAEARHSPHTLTAPPEHSAATSILNARRAGLSARTPAQREYLYSILRHDLTFGIGPAGTGKTFLAVACAIDALEREQVKRIVLTWPAVEAGERLGFLPGDLAQKVDPYLRPLYDALY